MTITLHIAFLAAILGAVAALWLGHLSAAAVFAILAILASVGAEMLSPPHTPNDDDLGNLDC